MKTLMGFKPQHQSAKKSMEGLKENKDRLSLTTKSKSAVLSNEERFF